MYISDVSLMLIHVAIGRLVLFIKLQSNISTSWLQTVTIEPRFSWVNGLVKIHKIHQIHWIQNTLNTLNTRNTKIHKIQQIQIWTSLESKKRVNTQSQHTSNGKQRTQEIESLFLEIASWSQEPNQAQNSIHAFFSSNNKIWITFLRALCRCVWEEELERRSNSSCAIYFLCGQFTNKT